MRVFFQVFSAYGHDHKWPCLQCCFVLAVLISMNKPEPRDHYFQFSCMKNASYPEGQASYALLATRTKIAQNKLLFSWAAYLHSPSEKGSESSSRTRVENAIGFCLMSLH